MVAICRGPSLRSLALGCLALAACCSLGKAQEAKAPPQAKDEPLFRWVDLQRHPANPLMRAIPGTWETQWFVVSTAIPVNGRLHLYYEASDPTGNAASRLGLALSDDGIRWERYQGNPIWSKQGNWEHFLRDVRVYQFDGEPGYRMYYSDGDRHVDLARSTDGVHWQNCEHNPILAPSQDWEDFVMQPSVLKVGDQWTMWYSTYGRKPRVTGMATSTDGVHWTKHEQNPVLPLGKPGAWDDYSAFQPWVFRQDGHFHMLYTGSSRENRTGYRTGHAWSRDGFHWTKSPDNPIFVPGANGAWDGGKVSGHVLHRTGPGTYNIYYSAARTPGATYLGHGLVRGRLERAASRQREDPTAPRAPATTAERSEPVKGSVKIVAFGDSITNGASPAGMTEADTFRQVVRRQLTERLGTTVEVVNAGVNGDIVTLATGRLQRDVLDRKPDLVTIMFGGNEAGFYRPETNGFADTPRVSRDQFAATVAKIVDRVRAQGITVVLMTCPPMTERYWGMHLEPYRKHGINFLVKDYAQAMRDVAAEKGVELVDVYRAFEEKPERLDYFPDGLHPDARGHRVIADLLVERLASIIVRRSLGR